MQMVETLTKFEALTCKMVEALTK